MRKARGLMSNGTVNKRDELHQPIAIYYEHPDWFKPLFQRLDESGVAWKKVDARNHQYDAASSEEGFSLLFNRMSPSYVAWAISKANVLRFFACVVRSPSSKLTTSSWFLPV